MRTRNKIFALLSTLCLTVSVASATNSPFVYTPDYSDGTANVYTYEPYSQYEINTVVGFVTDIQLRQNEKLQKLPPVIPYNGLLIPILFLALNMCTSNRQLTD